MSAAVVMQDVSFGYEARSPIVQVKDLQIEKGKRVFLHGSSGSGKSTLLGLIAGVLLPQQGSCEVLGKELTQLSLSARDRHRGSEMGYIFQSFNLIPYLTVKENIELPCRVHGKRRKRITAPTLDEEVERIARRLDIHDFLDRGVTRLSTGQQQRVAIARAVIGSPRLVIADEPTSALDTDRQERFLQLLLEVCDEARATLIFVSHDTSLMAHFDQRISLAEINHASTNQVSL
jgi:putative ABC transport system ATP-binding protein